MLGHLAFFALLLIIIGSVFYQSSSVYSFRQRYKRRLYGQHYGYRYRPPRRVAWIPAPFLSLVTSVTCPTGCSNIGRGRWGCSNPGYDRNSCMFATDCRFCGL